MLDPCVQNGVDGGGGHVQPCSVCPHFRPCILTPCSLHGTCPERKTRSELEEDEDIAQTEITAENVPYAGSCRAESPPGSAQHALQRVSSVRLYLRARRPKRPRPSEISISSSCLPCCSWSARHVAALRLRVAHWLPGWVRVSAWLVAACMLLSCIQLRLASRNAVAFAQWPVGHRSSLLSSSLFISRVLVWERAYSGVTVKRAVPLAVGAHAELTSALFDLVPVFQFFFVRDTAGF